jgi:hypothetical protein
LGGTKVSRSIHDEELLHDHDEELLHDHDDAGGGGGLGAFSQKTKVMLVAAVVVMGAIAGAIALFTLDEGGAVAVELTPPSRSEDLLTFAYTIRTERAGATGPTTLTVSMGTETLHTRTFAAQGGGGRLDVRLSDFVIGNGEYAFKLAYKDKSTTVRYTIGTPDATNFIVTAIGAPTVPPGADTVSVTYVDDGHRGAIFYSVYFFSDIDAGFQTKAPPDSFLTMQVVKNGFPDGGPLNVSVAGLTFYNHIFNVSLGPGNYSVDATFTNQWVKPTAPVKTLSLHNTTFVQNKPYACVGGPYHGNAANSFTITADASCSHDDIGIAIYTWDFGDGTPVVTNGQIPTEGHIYPSSTLLKTYTGVVCVDDGMSPVSADPMLLCAEFTVTTSQN